MTRKFGALLREYRKRLGLTQKGLYDELEDYGCDYREKQGAPLISRWETGQRNPPKDVVEALEHILGVPDNQLLKFAGYVALVREQKYFIEWREQLNSAPPELIDIGGLGRIGVNSAPLGQDILNVVLEDLQFTARVTQTTWGPSYTPTTSRIFWELPLEGPPKLLCLVERQPGFQELLAKLTDEGKQNFGEWKSLGGYLEACIHARRTIHDQAKARAGGLVAVDSILDKIRPVLPLPPGPSHLNVEFGDLIYSLSIECCRSPNVLDIVKKLYHTRPKGPLDDLLFGRCEPPLATGLPGEIERCTRLHQLMVKEFAQSKMISRLIEEHEQILSLEEVVRGELDKIIESFLPPND